MHFGSNSHSEEEVDREELREKKWNKILQKICFDPPNEDYYLKMPVKPGFWFWKLLALHSKSLEKLKIRIPHSLVVLGNNNFVLLSYDAQKQGIVRKTELDITLNEFEKIILSEVEPKYLKENYYYLLQRTPGRIENEVSKSVFSHHAWKAKRAMGSNLDYPSMLQQYIYTKSGTANITRVCYKTHNCQKTEASYGFKLSNHIDIHDKNHKIPLSRKATICKDSINSFDVTLLAGGVLKEYIDICSTLVIFLEKSYKARISRNSLRFYYKHKKLACTLQRKVDADSENLETYKKKNTTNSKKFKRFDLFCLLQVMWTYF